MALGEVLARELVVDALALDRARRPVAVAAAGDKVGSHDLAAALEPLAVGVVDAEHDALDGPTVCAEARARLEQRAQRGPERL